MASILSSRVILVAGVVATLVIGGGSLRAEVPPRVGKPPLGRTTPHGPLDWFAVDGHVHSDVTPDAQGCTLEQAVEQAAQAGLDAVVITEHNFVHAAEVLRAVESRRAVRVYGGEEAGFRGGHLGVWGAPHHTRGAGGDRSLAAVVDAVHAYDNNVDLLVILNHPAWWLGLDLFAEDVLRRPDDVPRIDAIEVWNGQLARATNANVARWETLLAHGLFVPAIGSSDSHYRGVGRPATVLLARDVSLPSLVRAARLGRGYVSDDAWIDLDVLGRTYGSLIVLPRPMPLPVHLRGHSASGGSLRLIRSGRVIATRELLPGEEFSFFEVVDSGERDGWLRVEIRRFMDSGRRRGDQVVFIGNPVRWDVLPAGDFWR